MFTKTKGGGANIVTSIEGNINDEKGSNAVYALQQFMRAELGDWDATLEDNLRLMKSYVFNRDPDSGVYSARLKKIAENAGLNFGTFHGVYILFIFIIYLIMFFLLHIYHFVLLVLLVLLVNCYYFKVHSCF